jgi:hypothetical protein
MPLVVQFSDVSSAQSWLSSNTSGIVENNDCAAGQNLGEWTYQNSNAGTLGCMYVSSSDFRMIWVISSADVGVIADGSHRGAVGRPAHAISVGVSDGCPVSGQGGLGVAVQEPLGIHLGDQVVVDEPFHGAALGAGGRRCTRSTAGPDTPRSARP